MSFRNFAEDRLQRPVATLARRSILYWCLLALPAATMAQSFLEQFPYHQQTRYFEFYCKRNPQRMAGITRFADGFITLLNRDFFKADFDYPIRVLVLEDRARFQEFLRREIHDPDPPGFGIYLGKHKLFATYEDSGLGTFAHEIMHPLVERNLRNRPLWAMEGIPTFFEKFYGYWEQDDLVVHWGYQNPWRIEALGTNLIHLDLHAILGTTQSQGQYHESDLRMVSMFLWEQGRFQRFLRLIERGEMNGYKSYFEAALEMPVEQAVPLWQDYLDKVAARRSEIVRLPPSAILANESDWGRFMKLNEISVPPAKNATNAPPARR
jgi:hypothetical protein